VDEILAALDPWKDLLVDVKLGPFVLLDFAKENRLTTFSDIVFTDDFSDFKVLPDKENTIRFEGAELDETIYPYVVGLSFNQDNHSVSILPLEEVKSRKENFSEKKQFEKLGVFALVFFLVALTGNYFYQGSLITKNSEIEEKIMIYSDNLNKIDLLDQEIKRKTQLITTSGIVKQNFISFYLDRIASTVPDKITLKDVKAFPAQKKIKQKVKPEFEQNSIFIDGTTSSTGAIDEWIEKLNQLEWIDKTEIIHFEQNQEKRVANFSFRLTIK
jgi:Tfp pilus assembly protein PilN